MNWTMISSYDITHVKVYITYDIMYDVTIILTMISHMIMWYHILTMISHVVSHVMLSSHQVMQLLFTCDVMRDVAVWYHNDVISLTKYCDIWHHMWNHEKPRDTSYVISHSFFHITVWYQMWNHSMTSQCDITSEYVTSRVRSHVCFHMCYYMWYHLITISQMISHPSSRLKPVWLLLGPGLSELCHRCSFVVRASDSKAWSTNPLS
jgi:hypothetical protein